LVDRKKGKPVRKLELRSRDGRLLTPADTAVKPRGPVRKMARSTAAKST
jgi:hypothetical protein